jgi:hypothetical protein
MDEESEFNGVNGSTGGYLQSPLTDEKIVELAFHDQPSAGHLAQLKRRDKDAEPDLGLRYGFSAKDLSDSGWGVIFPADTDPAVLEALRPLLDWRRAKASEKVAQRYQEYTGAAGYQQGETKFDFLNRDPHRMGPGDVEPDQVPYYLLIVGNPEEIPFSFQYMLDVQFAVGRLHFDTPEEYANYATSVVKAEKEPDSVARMRQAAFFGTNGNKATKRSADELVEPLAAYFENNPGWEVKRYLAEKATKEQLKTLLSQPPKAAFLFTATHGVGFNIGDPHQRERQGALLCQEGDGLGNGKVGPDDYLSAEDILETASPAGLISYHFACYGAGTPRMDDFSYIKNSQAREQVADKPFVARLAQRLLGHPKGGSLAFVGHVDRAWSTSFSWAGQPDIGTFKTMLDTLRDGYPIGFAVESMNDRYSHLATELNDLKKEIEFGANYNKRAAYVWKATNDARSYTILGDPAVRLALAG